MKTLALLFIAATAMAAPQRPVVQPQPLGSYVRSGVVVGGSAGSAFSILRLDKQKAPDGAERLVIVYGDDQGRPVRTDAAYFHIEVDEKGRRVSIDLAQVQKTAVDPKELAHLFQGSALVASTDMTMDPLDLSTNILLSLKGPAEVKASIESRGGAKTLVVDLKASKPGARGG